MSLLDHLNPFALAMRLRRELYRRGILTSYHAGVPIISVGNITMGGTGKSPLVMLLANYVRTRHGKRVAIVSRGYRRRSEGYLLVRDGTQTLARVEETGDEAQMFSESLPNDIIIVDEDRVHGARQAVNLGADVILLDDGYQHLRLKRDLDILLVDAARSLGEVVPFGRRREPLSAAKDAEMVLFSNSRSENNPGERVAAYLQPGAVIATTAPRAAGLVSLAHAPSSSLEDLRGKRVLAVSSIAAPGRFHALLEEHGLNVVAHELPDHAEYSDRIMAKIYSHAAEQGVVAIITTEKDSVKSRRYYERQPSPAPAYVLKMELEFLSGREGFYTRIDQVFTKDTHN